MSRDTSKDEGGLDANRATQTTVDFDRRGTRSAAIAGPSSAQPAGPGSAPTCGAGLRPRAGQQDSGAYPAYLCLSKTSICVRGWEVSFLRNSLSRCLLRHYWLLCPISRSRAALELEDLALRHQIGVLQRSARKRVKLSPLDRLLWAWLSRIWSDRRAGHCSARDGDCLASQGLWSVLELEDSAGPAGKTQASPRSPRLDPQDVSRKSHVGYASHPPVTR